MNIRYTLPEREQAALTPHLSGEKIAYCVPYDLREDGSFCSDGWIAVTKKRLFVLLDGGITDSVPLEAANHIECVPQIDSGLLLGKQGQRNGSSAASVCSIWCGFPTWRGGGRLLPRRKERGGQPGKGTVLPALRPGAAGTSLCPHCDGRGRGFGGCSICAGAIWCRLFV